MEEEKVIELEGKIVDYRQYATILLSMSIFLFVGLVIPKGYVQVTAPPSYFISSIFILLAAAVYFHRKALACKNLMDDL